MTKIEWVINTDGTQGKTWNPVTGCTKISLGCAHCYAERMSKRLTGRVGYPADDPFRVTLHPDRLEEPLHWRKPQMVFVCSMGDLFHDDVPDEFIDRVFAVMAICPQHTFQVLTKRPERMQAWFRRFDKIGEPVLGDSPIGNWLDGPCGSLLDLAREMPSGDENWQYVPPEYEDGRCINRGYWCWIGDEPMQRIIPWPLPNVWIGVTAENQEQADKRIPLLLETPAAVRFVSVEPMLGPIQIVPYLGEPYWWCESCGKAVHPARVTYDENHDGCGEMVEARGGINWLIVGGETGPGARPMHPEWVRSLRDQCQEAGVPFFFKSWGDWFPRDQWEHNPELVLPDDDVAYHDSPTTHVFRDGDDWYPVHRVGKKAAGHLLDGVEWRQFPERSAVS